MEDLDKTDVPEWVVFVGEKEEPIYQEAIFHSLQNHNRCVLKGLGRRKQKTLRLSNWAREIEGLRVKKIEPIEVNDTEGLKVVIVDE